MLSGRLSVVLYSYVQSLLNYYNLKMRLEQINYFLTEKPSPVGSKIHG